MWYVGTDVSEEIFNSFFGAQEELDGPRSRSGEGNGVELLVPAKVSSSAAQLSG